MFDELFFIFFIICSLILFYYKSKVVCCKCASENTKLKCVLLFSVATANCKSTVRRVADWDWRAAGSRNWREIYDYPRFVNRKARQAHTLATLVTFNSICLREREKDGKITKITNKVLQSQLKWSQMSTKKLCLTALSSKWQPSGRSSSLSLLQRLTVNQSLIFCC